MTAIPTAPFAAVPSGVPRESESSRAHTQRGPVANVAPETADAARTLAGPAHATLAGPAHATPAAPALRPDAIYSQARAENFPVASWLLPRAVRADLMALYGFARLTDDIGDEVQGDRMAALDWLEAELDRAVTGGATHPVLRRLATTIAAHHLPLQPFRDLVDANRQDQRVNRYETFEDLVGYCALSANPVGRLVLAVFERSTPSRQALSDNVCTGLQVVEHLQDVAEDFRQDRIYLPLADLRAEGCDEGDLGRASASASLRRVIATESARARRLLRSGAPLAASLPWRERVAVAAFAAGGLAALDAVEAAHFDVLAHRCRPRPGRVIARLALLLATPTTPTGPSGPTAPTRPSGPERSPADPPAPGAAR